MAKFSIKRLLPKSVNFRSKNLSKPDSWLTSLFAPKSKSGANTSANNVISLPAVWRAITLISESLASIPFEVLLERDGLIKIDKEHPLYTIISAEPSQLYTSFDFRRTLVTIACLTGNAYAYIEKDARTRRPVRFKIFDTVHQEMDVFISESGDPYYKHSSDSSKTYSYKEIIHIKGFSFNGVAGLDALSINRENYGIGISARDFGNEFYANGAFLTGYLSSPQKLTEEAYYRIQKSWNTAYTGAGNRGRTPVLEQGLEFKPTTINPDDASMIPVQKFNIQDISRIFGVPTHLLSDLERATFNNIEQLSLEFAKYTLRPWAKRIEQEFNRKVFLDAEKPYYRVRLNMNAFLRGDTETRSEFYRSGIQNGWLSVNEVRAFEKLNPVEGGDSYYIQQNMQKITSPALDGSETKDADVLQQKEQ